MGIDPKAIEQTEFATSFRGYDKPEVRRYLRRLARELEALQGKFDSSNGSSPVSEPGVAEDATLWPGASEAARNPDSTQNAVNSNGTSAPIGNDDERFQALGDRIASLLQSAHVSAAEVREGAEAEAEAKLVEAELDRASIKSVAESNAEGIVAAAHAEAAEIKAAAEAEAERLKFGADELHAAAQLAERDAEETKANAVAEGQNELKARHEELDALSLEAVKDRDQAMSELGDARGQVAELLGQARSQSEFIRHEAEEVIRSRVRRNMDQAEDRLNQLRNSEVASRERIIAAHRELAGAMARLDAEEAPSLPVDPEGFAINGAQERADRSNFGEIEASYDDLDVAADVADSEARRSLAPDVAELPTQEALGDSNLAPEQELLVTSEESAPSASDAQAGEAEPADSAIEVIDVEVLEPRAETRGAGDPNLSSVLGDDDPLDDAAAEAAADEDALGRLVREAMEKAVDSARTSDD